MARTTRSHATEDRPLARRIGARLRAERTRAGLTQAALADGRYTKAYVSALENGVVKPSMAALTFFAGKLGIPVTSLLAEPDRQWTRIDADVRLASGDWQGAYDAYTDLLAADGPEPARRAAPRPGRSEQPPRTRRGGGPCRGRGGRAVRGGRPALGCALGHVLGVVGPL